MGQLEGKVAIITGAASGMGAAMATRFTAEGAKVIMSDVQVEKSEALAHKIGAEFVSHDVANAAEWPAVMQAAAAHGRLDIMVNNAGIVLNGTIEDVNMDEFDRIVGINQRSVVLGCQLAVKAMKQNPEGPGGSIINMSSVTAYATTVTSTLYGMTKGGVMALTKAVAGHCARAGYNIRCNSLHPGAIDTPMLTAALDQVPNPEALKQIFNNLQPMGRMGQPEEIAALAVFLAGDESKFITGSEMLIDGGAMTILPNF